MSDEISVTAAPQDVLEEPTLLPRAEAPEPHEHVNVSEKEGDLPLCPITSVVSASVSPKKPVDFTDDDGGGLTATTPCNSEKDATPCGELQPDTDIPKKSTDEEISTPPSIAQNDSLINQQDNETVDPILQIDSGNIVNNQQTDCETRAPDVPMVEEVTLSDAITDHTEDQMDTSPKLAIVDSSVLLDGNPSIESSSTLSKSVAPETTGNLDNLNNSSTNTLVTEVPCGSDNDQSLVNDAGLVDEIGFSLNMNLEGDQLGTSCENEVTKLDISMSEWDALPKEVNDDHKSVQQTDTETCELGEDKPSHQVGKDLTTGLEENQDLTLLEHDDQTKETSPFTLDELLSDSDEQHQESKDQGSIREGEPDSVLHELDSQAARSIQEQSESGKEDEDHGLVSSRPTNPEDSESALPDDSEKDGGDQGTTWKCDLESRAAEISIEKNVEEKIEPNICEFTQGVGEMETLVCSPKMNSSNTENNATLLLEQGALEDEHIMADQRDSILSDHNERDLFDEPGIFPLDAQLEAGETAHPPGEQVEKIALEKETNNTVLVHATLRDICLQDQDELSQVPSTILTCENEMVSPLEQAEHKEADVGPITTDKTHLEMDSMGDKEPSEKSSSTQNAQPEMCDGEVAADAGDPDISLTEHDVQTDQDISYNISSHAADTELSSSVSLLSSDKSAVGNVEIRESDPAVCALVQDTVSEHGGEEELAFTEDSSSSHIGDEVVTQECDPIAQEPEKDLSSDQPNDEQTQVGSPEVNSTEESSLSNTADTDQLSTHEENIDVSLPVPDNECNDNTEKTDSFDSSPLKNMIQASDENEPTSSVENPGLKSVTTCGEPESSKQLETCGDGLSLPYNEDTSDASSLTNDKEESQGIFSGKPQLSSKPTCSRKDEEEILAEINEECEQENEIPPPDEQDILQSLGRDQKGKDTNAESSGIPEVMNEEIVDKQITFHERDLKSDSPFKKTDGIQQTLTGQTLNQSADLDRIPDSGDRGGTQEECRDNDLAESISHEQTQDTLNSLISSADLEGPCQIKDVEDDIDNSSAVLHHESGDKVTDDNIVAAVSGGGNGTTSSEVSDVVSLCKSQSVEDGAPDSPKVSQLTNKESEEGATEMKMFDRPLGAGSQCLKCGRKLRRGRKELVWSPVCFKCRFKAKKQERRAIQEMLETSDLALEPEENLLYEFSNRKIKQEADGLQDEISVEAVKPLGNKSISAHVKQEGSGPIPKKYKCPKCDKSFRIPVLLAGHMKCHTLPQCLTCGCQMQLKYKTRRIPRRCQKCIQQIKKQRKDEKALTSENSGDEDSLKSDNETIASSVTDSQSVIPEDDLSDNEPTLISSKSHKKPFTKTKFRQAKGQPIRVRRGAERFQSVLLKKNKKVNPGVQALYCTCGAAVKWGVRQSVKKCQHCHKPIRSRMITPASLHKAKLMASQLDSSDSSQDGDLAPRNKLKKDIPDVLGQKADGKRPLKKKVKKQVSPESETQSAKLQLVMGESPDELNPCKNVDEICKKEETESSDEQDDDGMMLPDGDKPRLCPQCGKAFKCNRSLNLHLLSHTAIQCESCGCRLQKKRRGGRWSKKCRICRLHSKDQGFPDGAEQGVLSSDKIPKEKNTASLRLKVKQSKNVKKRKLQSIAKQKKDIQWMNMLMAVKGLIRKPKKKKELTQVQDPTKSTNVVKENLESSSSESDRSDSVSSTVEDKTSVSKGLATLPKYDIQEAGPSGIHYPRKKILSGIHKPGRKCLYTAKNIIKVEENQHLPYIHNPAVSIKEEEENQCLECNQSFASLDLLLSHQPSHVGDQPFPCSQCPQSFSKEQYLNNHMNTHSEERPFRCPECNKTFTRRNHLGVHRRVHSGARPFACPECPCRFRQKGSLIVHRYTHKNIQLFLSKPYQCSICSKSFKQKERLVVHERLHTGECPFSCKDCDKVFPSKARLYVHRKMHKACEPASTVQENPICKEELEVHPYQCQDCDKVCSTKASLVLHRKVHKAPSGTEQNVEEHPFYCRDCNKVFSTKASLSLHIKLHTAHRVTSNCEKNLDLKTDTDGPSFTCKDCDKVCSTKASFVLHSKVHKSPSISEQVDIKPVVKSPPFICKDCDKVCSTKASFVLHRKVHKSSSSSENVPKADMEQQSFVCKHCDVVCSTKASLVLHRKTHKALSSGEQKLKVDLEKHPFICKDCDKVCSTKASLVLHRKVHKSLPSCEENPKGDLEEHSFHCKDCGKIFATKGRLSAHSKLHTAVQNPSGSDQSTGNKTDVEQPQKTDIEEKPFSCPKCRLRFTRLKMLVRHKLIHGEDGIFLCAHCGKRFLFQKSMLNHGKICQSRNKGKSLLGKKKVAMKRKIMKVVGDSTSGEETALKKRKISESKKAMSSAQQEKKKKMIKKLAMNKEKCKTKDMKDKKPKLKEKRPKGDGEADPDGEAKKTSDGKQEKLSETLAKEKEAAKERKQKDAGKVNKGVKKAPPKEKRPKDKGEGVKKWKIIAGTTVKKRKLQISGGKKKLQVKKKGGQQKAKSGGKSGQGGKDKN